MISKIFFLIIVLYILFALFIAKEKYHLVLVPFILDSNFFGFFTLPFGQKNQDLVFVVIIMLWMFFMSYKTKTYWTKHLQNHRNVVIFFLSFLVLVLIVSWFQYHELVPTFMVFRRIFRYVVIFFLVSILFRFSKSELNKLGDLIEKISVFLAFLYIIHSGAGIPIFEAENYGERNMRGVDILRNFGALPYFLMFSLSHVALKEKTGAYKIAAIFILFIAIFLSYTRSMVVTGIIILMASLYIRGVKYSQSILSLIKIATVVPIAIILAALVISQVFPTQTKFFLSRIDNINDTNSALEDKTMNLRTKIIVSRMEKVMEVNPLTGLGFVHEESNRIHYPDLFIRKGDRKGQIIVGDQSWGNLIATIGYLGTIMFIIMLLFPIMYLVSKKMFIKQEIPLIAASLDLMGMLFLKSYFDTILIKGVYLIAFLIALILVYTNYYIVELYSSKQSTDHEKEGLKNVNYNTVI